MKNLQERLESIGYSKACARAIVNDYQHTGKTHELLEYIHQKEYQRMMERSITEHVQEVIG